MKQPVDSTLPRVAIFIVKAFDGDFGVLIAYGNISFIMFFAGG